MFQNLQEKLEEAFKKFKNKGKLTEKDVFGLVAVGQGIAFFAGSRHGGVFVAHHFDLLRRSSFGDEFEISDFQKFALFVHVGKRIDAHGFHHGQVYAVAALGGKTAAVERYRHFAPVGRRRNKLAMDIPLGTFCHKNH